MQAMDTSHPAFLQNDLLPILGKYKTYFLQSPHIPELLAKICGTELVILLDSGAVVSVLPKSLIEQFLNLPNESFSHKPVKAFGGCEINLDGPIHLTVEICGLKLVHPFYYLDAQIPAIGGYDLMRTAQLVLDSHGQKVWSNHPDVTCECHCDITPDLGNAARPTDFTVLSTSVEGTMTPTSCATLATSSCTPNGAQWAGCSVPSSVLASAVSDAQSSATFSVMPPQDTQQDTASLPSHLLHLYEDTVSHTTLSSSVDAQFQDILYKHSTTFATSNTDIGFCDVLRHDIDTGDSPPIKQSPRRPPLSAGDAENEIIEDMLNAGVIEHSTAEWASPVCLVKKPDGTYRFCIDYRRVNAVSRKDGYPVPDIQDALDNLRGAKWFATLDLLSGYWQVGMTERAKERSAFCTRRGLFQFKRMPFGLCGAPATFCRLMNHIFKDYLGRYCLCYLDDLIVYASTQQELLDRLDLILTRLRQFGLKVKPSKCVLFRKEIDFLGHVVSAAGVEPQPDKVTAIRNWPTPRCLRDVRAFYGLVGYYRRFIQGFATLAEPLTRLTKKGTKFFWNQDADLAFKRLKQSMLDVPTLSFPYPDRPCILDTDSSDVAYGSVLSQIIDGQERPIAFFSRVMTTSQRNYCATRRELLAVIASLQHFRHYLLHIPVILRTDHHSLKWLRTFKRPEGILARWIETLSEFHITIEHRPGRVHSNADGLSRQHCKQCWGRVPKEPWVDELARADECVGPLGLHTIQILPELSNDDLSNLQSDDPVIGPVRSWLEMSYEPTVDELREIPPEGRKLWSVRSTITTVQNVLVRNFEGTTKLVVPEVLRRRLFQQAHAGPLAAHLGFDRTHHQLKSKYYWPGMTRDVKLWCQACDVCARCRGPPPRPHAPMRKVIAAAPMDLVAIDILSGFPTASDGSTCILVAVDYMTKWAEAYPLPNEEASTCMTALYSHFFARFGFPSQIHSDQGRNFESRLVAELTKIAGIRRSRTTPFHPRSDGQTERMNRTILQMLRATAHDDPTDWPQKLPVILAAYRMTPHKTTGVSPNLAMLGREVMCPCTLIAAPPEEPLQTLVPYTAKFREDMRSAHQRVRAATRRSARTQKSYFDARAKTISLTVGQLVWLYWPRPQVRQQKRKLTQLWVGPFRVIDFKSDIVVRIQHIRTNKFQTVHVDRLVPCSSVPTIITPARTPVSSQNTSHRTLRQPLISAEHQASSTPESSPDLVNTSRSGRTVRPPRRYAD